MQLQPKTDHLAINWFFYFFSHLSFVDYTAHIHVNRTKNFKDVCWNILPEVQ